MPCLCLSLATRKDMACWECALVVAMAYPVVLYPLHDVAHLLHKVRVVYTLTNTVYVHIRCEWLTQCVLTTAGTIKVCTDTAPVT